MFKKVVFKNLVGGHTYNNNDQFHGAHVRLYNVLVVNGLVALPLLKRLGAFFDFLATKTAITPSELLVLFSQFAANAKVCRHQSAPPVFIAIV